MTGQRWQQLKDVLQAAWGMDAGERAAFLDQVCAQDPKLRSDVEALLMSDQHIGEFLAAPAVHLTSDPETYDSGDDWLGRRVGPYRIRREIGHGGMGTVYLAERADGQYHKQVAMKLVNPPHGDTHFLRRFLRERQLLAGLEHPNVVRLLDGGATEDGLPYLVMEHVEGVRIDTWCETRKLAVRDCVRLFRNVCAAVEYAHRKEVIHLDIKPGNILVTADGVPKLLDFGVARVLNPERSAEITETRPGPRPMTPEYASPEQARGEPVGPATDIYALGLVLHRLLSGHLPFTLHDATVGRQLDGDLDSILRKALNPVPGGRYASVAEFSDDLERFLNDLPIRARKANLAYRGRKLIKRNWVTASLVTALLAVSMLVVAVSRPRSAAHKSSIGVHTAKLRAPEEPVLGPEGTSASSGIPSRLLGGETSPESMAGTSLTANSEALKAYEEGLNYRTRFRTREAINALRRAIDLDPEFVMAHYQLADSIQFEGNVPEARRSIALAVQLAERAPAPSLQRRLVHALQMSLDLRLEDAAKILESIHQEFPQEIEPLFQLAGISAACANFADAAALLEKVVRLDWRCALAHDHLGYQYAFLGDVARAVASIDRYAALLPPDNEVPFWSRGNAYMINERYDEALAQYRNVDYQGSTAMAALHAGHYNLPTLQRLRTSMTTKSGASQFGLAGDLAAALGQLDQSAPYYEGAVTKYEAEGPLRAWFGVLSAARVHFEQNRPEEVLALARRLDNPWAPGLRGTVYLLLHQEAEAEREFDSLRDSVAPVLGDYLAQETVEFHRMQAASYAGHFDQVIQMWPRLPRSWWSLYALDVGRAYLKTGLFAEAERHLRLACKAQQAYFVNGDMKAQHNLLTWMLAQFYLGEVMEKTGRRAEAIARYQGFVKHFENSSPALPQIAAARTILERLQLSKRGKLLFSDEFSGSTLGSGWEEAGKPGVGSWEVAGGLATAWTRPGEIGSIGRRRLIAYHDAIFEFSFRTDGAEAISISPTDMDRNLNLARFYLFKDSIVLRARQPSESGGSAVGTLERLETAIEPGKWHKVVLEVRGKRVIAQLDNKPPIAGETPAMDVDKYSFCLFVQGSRTSFDYIRIYDVASK